MNRPLLHLGLSVSVALVVGAGTVPAEPASPRLDAPAAVIAADGKFEALAFAPDRRSLVGFRSGTGVEVFEWPSGRLLSRLAIEKPLYGPLAVSADGTIAAGGPDQTSILLWKPPAPAPFRILESGGPTLDALAFSPDGRRLAAGDHDGRILFWSVATGEKEREFLGHIASVNTVGFCPDGSLLATGANDNDICLWDTATGKLVRRIDSPTHSVFALAWSRDGQLFTGGASGTVTRWDAASGRPTTESTRFPHVVVALRISPDGRTVAAGGMDPETIQRPGDFWLLDAQSLSERRRVRAHSGIVVATAFSPDGEGLVSASDLEPGIKSWPVSGLRKPSE